MHEFKHMNLRTNVAQAKANISAVSVPARYTSQCRCFNKVNFFVVSGCRLVASVTARWLAWFVITLLKVKVKVFQILLRLWCWRTFPPYSWFVLLIKTCQIWLQWWFVNPGSDSPEISLVRTKSAIYKWSGEQVTALDWISKEIGYIYAIY